MTLTRTLVGLLLFLLCSPLSAQIRADLGIAAGQQSYAHLDSPFLISPELMLSRGPLALYYSLDYGDLSSPDVTIGTVFASHLGLAYRWPIGRNLAVRAGAGPSYVTVQRLGGKPTWHAQAELALRTRRVEWFAKVRHYDYSLSERQGTANPDGPALLAGVRFTLIE